MRCSTVLIAAAAAAPAFAAVTSSSSPKSAAWEGCNITIFKSKDCSGNWFSFSNHDCGRNQACNVLPQGAGSVRLDCFNGCNGGLIVSKGTSCYTGVVAAPNECVKVYGIGEHARVIW